MRTPLVFLAVLPFVAAVISTDALAGVTTRVSVDSSGGQGNGDSMWGSLSWDGRYVAFQSDATNLVAGDTNGVTDVFVHDRVSGTTTRVSVDSSGAQANGLSGGPAISANGQCVAFSSRATNLVPNDTNGCFDVFVHDRTTHQTIRVSVDSSGVQGDGDSSGTWFAPALSDDGQVVVFGSAADNLVPNDLGWWDIFVHDRRTGITSRVSVDPNGQQGDGDSTYPSVSSDGSIVAFSSWASNLVPGDTNFSCDAFVRDLRSGVTRRVSVSSDGVQGDWSSIGTAISGDGRLVGFGSNASNLVPEDRNGRNDVFLHDLVTGETRLVSTGLDGRQFPLDSWIPYLSRDGTCVGWTTGTGASQFLGYVQEVATRHTTLVTLNSDGDYPKYDSGSYAEISAISGDGRVSAIGTYAYNLVNGDTNHTWDVFVNERAVLAISGVPKNPSPFHFTITRAEPRNLALVLLSASGSGGFVIYDRHVPLTFDQLTVAGLGFWPFLSAVADDNGTANTPELIFPMMDPGQIFYASALSLELPSGRIESITAPTELVTQ